MGQAIFRKPMHAFPDMGAQMQDLLAWNQPQPQDALGPAQAWPPMHVPPYEPQGVPYAEAQARAVHPIAQVDMMRSGYQPAIIPRPEPLANGGQPVRVAAGRAVIDLTVDPPYQPARYG